MPLAQPGPNELGAIVRTQLRGATMTVDQASEHLHHVTGWQGEVNFHAEQLTVVIVAHIQRPKPAAIGPYIADEVELPTHSGCHGLLHPSWHALFPAPG
jgi:hypothetical protein